MTLRGLDEFIDAIFEGEILEQTKSIVPFQEVNKLSNFLFVEITDGKFLTHERFELLAIDVPLIVPLGTDNAERYGSRSRRLQQVP